MNTNFDEALAIEAKIEEIDAEIQRLKDKKADLRVDKIQAFRKNDSAYQDAIKAQLKECVEALDEIAKNRMFNQEDGEAARDVAIHALHAIGKGEEWS